MTTAEEFRERAERAARAQANGGATTPERPTLNVKWAADVEAHTTGLYVVKGLIPTDALVQVIGEPSCGKSAVVLDLSGHVAAQRTYRGRRVRGGPVAYFALENSRSIENRLLAWCRHYGIDRASLPLAIISGSLDVRDEDSVTGAVGLLQSATARFGQFVAVVIDTQSRAMPGAKENAGEDMSRLIAACDQIRTTLGVTVILIHHTGKDPTLGGRGHSSQLGAVDVTIDVANRQIKLGKVRDGDQGEAIGFHLHPVELGNDEDGEPVAAVVAVEASQARAAQSRPPTGHAATALRAFDDLLLDGLASTSPGTSTMPVGVRYLSLDEWRGRFMRYLGQESDRTEEDARSDRSAWRDAKKVLVDRGYVRIDGQVTWRT